MQSFAEVRDTCPRDAAAEELARLAQKVRADVAEHLTEGAYARGHADGTRKASRGFRLLIDELQKHVDDLEATKGSVRHFKRDVHDALRKAAKRLDGVIGGEVSDDDDDE